MELSGPLGTPLGLAQRKRASPRGEAGTSGFLCVSDSDRRVPAELGLVLSEEGNPAGLSSCSGGLRPLVELCVEPAGVSGRCTGVSVPLRAVPSPTGLPSKRGPSSGSSQELTGESGSFGMWHHPRGSSRMSSCDRPPLEVRRQVREPLPDHAGESPLLSRSGGEKGLR